MEGFGEHNNEILILEFNPKKRWVVTAGSTYMAYLWDLTKEGNFSDLKPKKLPHVT